LTYSDLLLKNRANFPKFSHFVLSAVMIFFEFWISLKDPKARVFRKVNSEKFSSS